MVSSYKSITEIGWKIKRSLFSPYQVGNIKALILTRRAFVVGFIQSA